MDGAPPVGATPQLNSSDKAAFKALALSSGSWVIPLYIKK
jgi:hypothetical protein